MEIGNKVFVKDWGQNYSSFYRWKDDVRELIWNWKTEIPDYSDTMFFVRHEYVPKLTQKGVPYKNGEKVLVSSTPAYKNYEYTILEAKQHPEQKDVIVFLLKSKEGCFVQINNKGISTMTPLQQKQVAHLETEKRLQALAVDNLGKWSLTSNPRDFPKELTKYLYDVNQNTQFGSGMTKAIIRYPYIPKEYTINGNDLCLGWEQDFNGKGCNLAEKDTITWSDLKKRFPENEFNG